MKLKLEIYRIAGIMILGLIAHDVLPQPGQQPFLTNYQVEDAIKYRYDCLTMCRNDTVIHPECCGKIAELEIKDGYYHFRLKKSGYKVFWSFTDELFLLPVKGEFEVVFRHEFLRNHAMVSVQLGEEKKENGIKRKPLRLYLEQGYHGYIAIKQLNQRGYDLVESQKVIKRGVLLPVNKYTIRRMNNECSLFINEVYIGTMPLDEMTNGIMIIMLKWLNVTFEKMEFRAY